MNHPTEGKSYDELKAENAALRSLNGTLGKDLIRTAKERDELRAALKFYADATPADFAKDNGYKATAVLEFSSQQNSTDG